MKPRCIFILFFLSALSIVGSVTFSNLGEEFFLCYPGNACRETGGNPVPFYNGQIILTSTVATIGTVQTRTGSFLEEFTIPAYGTATVSIDSTLWLRNSEYVYDRGLSIRAADTIAAYFLSYEEPGATNDMTLLFPVQSLGQEYLVMCWRDNIPTSGYFPHILNHGPSMFAIVAPFDATHITITPSVTTEGGHAAGVPFDITLDAYEAYQVLANSPSISDLYDLTGSEILADKPVAVFAGSQLAFVPDTIFAADYLIEQIPPLTAWGKNFNAFPIEGRNCWEKDVLKILASEDATTVNLEDASGDTIIHLDRGEYFEWNGYPCDPGNYVPLGGYAADCEGKLMDSPTRIESDKPILVGQFITGGVLTKCNPGISGSGSTPYGDPAYMMIPPAEQYGKRYVFLIPPGYTNDYLNVAIEGGYEGTVTLDGGPPTFSTSWFDIPSTSMRGARIEVDPGNHVLLADTTMLLQIYAFDDYWASYAAVGGQKIAIINAAYEIVKFCELTPAISGYNTRWRIVLRQVIGTGSHSITIGDTLPPDFTLSSTPVDIQLFGSATRDSVLEPVPGDSILVWGWFSMEAEDSIVITFDADILIGVEGRFDNGVWIANEYGLKADNAYGLMDSLDDVVVIMPPMPIADAGPDTFTMAGTSINIGGSPTASSGTPPYIIEWTSDPVGFTSSDANPLVSPAGLTEYIVCVTDSFGFFDYDSCIVDITMEERHIEFGIADGYPCDIVYIPLYIDSIHYCSIDSAWMRFAVDPDILTPTNIIVSGTMTDAWAVSGLNIDATSGTIEAWIHGPRLADLPGGILLMLEASIDCEAIGGTSSPVVVDSFFFNDGQPAVTWSPGMCFVQLTPARFSCDIRLNRTSGVPTEDNVFTIGATHAATDGYDAGLDWILVPAPATFVQGLLDIDDTLNPHIEALRKDMRDVSPPKTWLLITEGESNGVARWSSASLPEGVFRIDGLVDMKRDTMIYFGLDDTLVIEWLVPELESAGLTLYSGWNMVSSPVHPAEIPANEIFHTEFGVFRYLSLACCYDFADLIQRGEGYWVWCPAETTIYIAGSEITGYRWSVYRGWNLIGAPKECVSTADIDITPSGGILGDIYHWDGSTYIAVDSLCPGKGYWLLSNNEGILHVPTGYRRRPSPVPETVWETALTLKFGDSIERLSIGYAPDAASGLGYGDIALPPVPPNSDGYLCALVADGIQLERDLSPDNRWELNNTEQCDMSLDIPDDMNILVDGIEITDGVPVPLSVGRHIIVALAERPEKFAVLGCVPNPFNAQTDIVVAIPHNGAVFVEMFDLSGRSVWSGESDYPAGIVRIPWEGEDHTGAGVSTGLYLARVTFADESIVVKAMFIK